MGDMVEELMSFTGLERDEAATLLEASNFDLAAAAQLHFEQQEGRAPAGSFGAAASQAEQVISEDDYDMALEDDQMDLADALNMDPDARADHIEQVAAARAAGGGSFLRS